MGQAMAREALVLEETARAKVNLTLSVLGRRADGYHELDSIVAFADVGDMVRLIPGERVSAAVTGPFAAEIIGENLASRALDLLGKAHPELLLGLVEIDKRLPVAAGVGGGSADAAAVLRLVKRANPDHAADVDWEQIALQLGSDVPVCLMQKSCRMQGRGDVISALPYEIDVPVVLANAREPVPADKTARVFRALAAAPFVSGEDRGVRHFAHGRNDLEDVAREVLPGVRNVLDALASLDGARWTRLSGAGATCFATFDSVAAARAGAAALRATHPDWWVCEARLS